jgi:hypothetical protein
MPNYRNLVSADSDPTNAGEAAYIHSILAANPASPSLSVEGHRSKLEWYDDFLVDSLDTFHYTGTAVGTTGNDVPVTGLATEPGGAITMASGTDANGAQEVAMGNISWKPSTMGPLTLEARFKVVAATEPIDGDFTFGFADAITFTSSVPFIMGATSAYTTDVPTEFAGFYYSSIPTSGAHAATTATPIGNYIGYHTVKNGTGTAASSTGVQKDSDYHTYRVTVSAAGLCMFYIDGDHVASSASAAVTIATALTPYFNVTTKASHENTMTIDYIYVSGTRP